MKLWDYTLRPSDEWAAQLREMGLRFGSDSGTALDPLTNTYRLMLGTAVVELPARDADALPMSIAGCSLDWRPLGRAMRFGHAWLAEVLYERTKILRTECADAVRHAVEVRLHTLLVEAGAWKGTLESSVEALLGKYEVRTCEPGDYDYGYEGALWLYNGRAWVFKDGCWEDQGQAAPLPGFVALYGGNTVARASGPCEHEGTKLRDIPEPARGPRVCCQGDWADDHE